MAYELKSINQILIFYAARITGVITKSTKASRYVNSYRKMSGNDWWNRYVISLWQTLVREVDD